MCRCVCVQLSEETRRLWRYESLLLRYYHRLLAFVRDVLHREVRASRRRRTGPINERAMTAVKGASRMMVKGLHFNYRKELIVYVVPLLNHPDHLVRRPVWHAVLQLFSSDPLGEATAEVVQIISKTIKNKRPTTHTQHNTDDTTAAVH